MQLDLHWTEIGPPKIGDDLHWTVWTVWTTLQNGPTVQYLLVDSLGLIPCGVVGESVGAPGAMAYPGEGQIGLREGCRGSESERMPL